MPFHGQQNQRLLSPGLRVGVKELADDPPLPIALSS
jgi:hypothetical protein